LNMMCMDSTTKSFFSSCYFLGFAFGLVLFMLPEKLGRKGCMNIILPIYIMASYLTIFGE